MNTTEKELLLEESFKRLTGFSPYGFQKETILKILNYESVVLRAPTGSGKTETAIAPFLFARNLKNNNQILNKFPNKLIYVVPLRTLATSLRERTESLVRKWESYNDSNRPLVVTLQTGENPEDPRFEGDIIFCTIDQMLSSFLNIRQFNYEMQRVLMKQRILRKGYDSQEIFSVCDL